jgi:hypothetical protein
MNEIWVIAIAAGFVIFVLWAYRWLRFPSVERKRSLKIQELWNEKQRIMGALSVAEVDLIDQCILRDRVKAIEAELWELGVMI